MHQRRESTQAKKKTSSMNNHLSSDRRRRASLRRTWSNGLPSLASDTVNMVVATLQIGYTMTELHEENVNINNEQEHDEDEYDDILNIGQQVQAHIPDIVLNNLNDLIDRKGNLSIPNEHTYNNATLLFLDVSGFTSLTEQYSNDAHLGIDQLTRTLNSYFDKLVYEILTHDGDLYKFAGDAILALWTNEITGTQQALKCALHLQQKCGAYETDVGVILRLKVALAYGSVTALFVGTDEFKHYLLTGDCVKDVNICEQLCEPGDILITKALHDKIQSTSFDCQFSPVSDDIDPKHEHIAVKYSLLRQSSFNEEFDIEDHSDNSTITSDRMDLSNQEIMNDMNNEQNSKDDLPIMELYSRIDLLMKSFLLRCVYQCIDRKQSLYYLSELRRVTISFINLDISNEQTINKNLTKNIHQIFSLIYELTKMMGGVLTKGLLFDKGWSFLCVFGLPGYKQGDDTANALKSAQMIHSTIRDQCPFVDKCSIGVTTGLTYCGVVGHRARCEYTVIGRKVNMAARLMCNYPDIVSCDQETYYNSRLHSRFFQILPDKALKGMNNVGIIWHYGDYHDLPQVNEQTKTTTIATTTTTTATRQISDIGREDYPLLGRRVELMIVAAQIMLLDEPINSANRRRDLAAIIFEGEDKIGRSRLLHFIATSLENSPNVNNISTMSYYDNTYIPTDSISNNNNTIIPTSDNEIEGKSSLNNYASDCAMIKKPSIKVINYRCQFEQRFNEFGLLRSLLKQLLQFHTNDQNQYEREQYLLRLFDINRTHDLYLRRNLFLLNDLLDVGFRHSQIETENNNDQNLAKAYEANINELLLHILNKLIESPSNLGEPYQGNSFGNITNKSFYAQSCISFGSTTSINSPSTIATVSKIIFIIDDIHFADPSSLKHLLTLGSHKQCLLILSLKPTRNNYKDQPNSFILQSISTDSRVYLRRLPGLELRYLATFGCQMLSVHRFPAKLVKIFNESCNGIPGFCEQILFDLLSKDKIYIVDNNDSHDQDSDLIEGDPDKLLLNNPIKNGLFKTFFSRRKQPITSEQRQNERAFSRLCLIRNPNEDDFNVDCQQNFQNYIMCRIDRLSEGESLLVKIAAIIGNTFSRVFLWHLVDTPSKKLINMNSCILEMMQRTIIECAFSRQQVTKTRSIKCYCLQNPGGFPSQCRLMAFTHSTIREGIYNSLTDGLKRLLTRNAIDYLEKHCSIVCLPCGASRNDSPFLVHEHDGLAKIIKNRQQHAFVDIVKMAALKEIDNAIKELSRLSNSPIRQRSSTLSKMLPESTTVNQTKSLDTHPDKHSVVMAVMSVESPPSKRKSSVPNNDLNNHEVSDTKSSVESPHNISDPNLTLISLYSPDALPKMQINVQRSLSAVTPSSPTQVFPLFRIPQQTPTLNTQSFETVDGIASNQSSSVTKSLVHASKKRKQDKTNRFISLVRYLFCQLVPIRSNATVTPTTPEENQVTTPVQAKEIEVPTKTSASWKKVRKAVLPAHSKIRRAMPDENELLRQTMFSTELMEKFSNDFHCLHKQISLTRTFEILYDRSLSFHVFQSYVQHKNLIQYVYECKETTPDLNQYLNEFNSYNDLRICECADHVMMVYIKLVEYHTNLYDIFEKMADDKRDHVRLKQFDRIMYYRIEICQLLLRCNCFQRLLVEIENGRKFLEKFQNDTNNQEDFIYHYQYLIIKYTYDLFQAILLQHSRAINDSKQLCERNLNELNQAHQTKIWEKLISNTESSDFETEKKQQQHEQRHDSSSKESSIDLNYCPPLSLTSNSDQFILFDGKYRLEYLLCQYHFLKHNLSRHESIDSINSLIDLQYYTFPLTFSISCTINLVEYFYCKTNYNQCLFLIDKIIHFWWAYVSPREKLEFAKLKYLSLIIELKQGSLNSAILSGYFAKRMLTGYHENIFLIESCIHLTLALIGEMRIVNIESILQHLEYLSEQTMNCYAKLWYYILVIDVAIELGYELLPITLDLLNNITKYRKKLRSGSHERSLLLVYSDCILAQIYARLGLFDASKIHFHQVLHQIKYDQMYLSNVDFRFKRSLLKLAEIQLLHWYHTKENEQSITMNYFILNQLNSEEFNSWNKSRFFIYQAYYDRLINDYRRRENYSIDNDFNWATSLRKAEEHAIKLDLEWIKHLRKAWLHPVSEQYSLQGKHSISAEHSSRRSPMLSKQPNRRFIRLSIPQIKTSVQNETFSEEQIKTIDNYSHQTFLDWRLVLNKNNSSQFQLYILPVRV